MNFFLKKDLRENNYLYNSRFTLWFAEVQCPEASLATQQLYSLFGRDYPDLWGFPGGSDSKESTCNAGDASSIPASERSPGDRNGNPLQYFCQGNPMDRGARQATVHRVPKCWTRLSNYTRMHLTYKYHYRNHLNDLVCPITLIIALWGKYHQPHFKDDQVEAKR